MSCWMISWKDWVMNSSGDIKTASITGDMNGSVTADSFFNLRVGGAMGADLTALGTGSHGYSVYAMTVIGASSGTWTLGHSLYLRGASTTAAWSIDSTERLESVVFSGNVAGSISADSIKVLESKGDMSATVTIVGASAPGGRGLTIGKVAGDVSGSWSIGGDVFYVYIAQQANGWTLNADSASRININTATNANLNITGRAVNVTTGNWLAGTLTADSVFALRVNGNFGANMTLAGTAIGAAAKVLQTMAVTGTIQNGTLSMAGNVGTISATSVTNANILVGASGATGVLGDFGGNTYTLNSLNLSGGNFSGSTLAAYSIGSLGLDAGEADSDGTLEYHDLLSSTGTFDGTTNVV